MQEAASSWHACFNQLDRRLAMRTTLLALIALFAVVPAASADFTVPPPYVWTIVPCPTWNCAVAELVAAAGDPNVIAVPTTDTEHPWIVMKRVLAGTFTEDPAMPWSIEHFSGVGEASARFSSINRVNCPVMLTTTAEGILVASRIPPRARAVRH
jgi:hypothetical protein